MKSIKLVEYKTADSKKAKKRDSTILKHVTMDRSRSVILDTIDLSKPRGTVPTIKSVKPTYENLKG